MYQSLIGIHHLLQVDGLVAVVGKGSILVEVLISCNDILGRSLCLDYCCAENATGKVAAIGDEVDRGVEAALYLRQRLVYLGNVLVTERLVDAKVV